MPRKRRYIFQSAESTLDSPSKFTQTTITSFFNCSKTPLEEVKNTRKMLFEKTLEKKGSDIVRSKVGKNLPHPIDDSEDDDCSSEGTEKQLDETCSPSQVSKHLPYPISDSEDDFEETSRVTNSSTIRVPIFKKILPDATSTPMKNLKDVNEFMNQNDSSTSDSTIIIDQTGLTRDGSSINILENITLSPLKEISLEQQGNKRQNKENESIERRSKKQRVLNFKESLTDNVNMNVEINFTMEENLGSVNQNQNPNGSPKSTKMISNKEQSPQTSVKKSLTTKNKYNSENVNESKSVASSSPKKSLKSPSKNGTVSKKEESSESLNFKRLDHLKQLFRNAVNSEYSKNLLMENEVQMIQQFLEMDAHHQYFLKKLYFRLPKWYNMRKLCNEIKLNDRLSDKEIMEMYKFFEGKQYIDTDLKKLETDVLLNMLQLGDLQRINNDFKLSKLNNKNKSTLIEALKKNSKTQMTLSMTKTSDILKKAAMKYLGCCMKLKDCIRKLFFKVCLTQVYSNPLYYDVRKYLDDKTYWNCVYPDYTVENYRPFSKREEFECFFEAVILKEDYRCALEGNDDLRMKICCDIAFERLGCITNDGKWSRYTSSFLHQFSAEYKYISMLTSGSQRLTKFHETSRIWLEFLIKQYNSHHAVGAWYKQLCHILIQYVKDYEQAAEKILEAFVLNRKYDIFNIIQKYDLSLLSNKLKKTKSFHLSATNSDMLASLHDYVINSDQFPKNMIKGQTDRNGKLGSRRTYSFIDANDEKNYGNVEVLVLNHYEKEKGYEGIHCEGRLLNILFVLLFWDIIYFYRVPNAFISNIQTAPLDMFSTCFYENRKEVIGERLKDIAENWEQDTMEKKLKENWDKHSHVESIIRVHSQEESTKRRKNPLDNFTELLKMFRCINRQVLADIFDRLARNYRMFHSGLPDLFLWNVETSKCKFVEVKGENDKLSVTQILWIQYLLDIKADVEVCHVNGVGAKKIKGKTSKEPKK